MRVDVICAVWPDRFVYAFIYYCKLFNHTCQIIMASYTIEQHVQMIKLFYQNQSSITQTLRLLHPFYGRPRGPSKSTLQRLVAKFGTTGSVNDQITPVRQKTSRSADNTAAVRKSVQENPG